MMYGLIMRRKLGSSGCLIRIKELPSGCQERVYRSQEGAGRKDKGRIEIFLVCVFLVLSFSALMIFSLLENIREKPWYVPSRRLVIQETVFHIPDLTLLPYVQGGVTKLAKMSVVEL